MPREDTNQHFVNSQDLLGSEFQQIQGSLAEGLGMAVWLLFQFLCHIVLGLLYQQMSYWAARSHRNTSGKIQNSCSINSENRALASSTLPYRSSKLCYLNYECIKYEGLFPFPGLSWKVHTAFGLFIQAAGLLSLKGSGTWVFNESPFAVLGLRLPS